MGGKDVEYEEVPTGVLQEALSQMLSNFFCLIECWVLHIVHLFRSAVDYSIPLHDLFELLNVSLGFWEVTDTLFSLPINLFPNLVVYRNRTVECEAFISDESCKLLLLFICQSIDHYYFKDLCI